MRSPPTSGLSLRKYRRAASPACAASPARWPPAASRPPVGVIGPTCKSQRSYGARRCRPATPGGFLSTGTSPPASFASAACRLRSSARDFAEREIMERQARSLRLDARELDHLGPFLGFGCNESAELGGAKNHWDGADIAE